MKKDIVKQYSFLLGMHRVSVYVWIYTIQTSPYPIWLYVWKCAIPLESEGTECGVDHMLEHIYHLVFICAYLHSEHMEGGPREEKRGYA